MSVPKTRSPFLYYAIVLLTGGMFSYGWILLLARDVNTVSSRTIFNTKALWLLIGLLFIVFVGSVAMLLVRLVTITDHQQTEGMEFVPIIATVTSILLLAAMFVLAVAIHRFTLLREGKKFTVGELVKIIGLTLLMNLSLPYLQTELNKLQLNLSKD